MTILILDPVGGPLLPFDEWFSGQDALVISSRPDRAPGGLPVRLVDPGWHSPEREAFRAASQGPIRAVVALDEFDLLRAATMRGHWHLPGQRREEALQCVDLAVQRNVLSQAGVATVRGAPASVGADVYQLAAAGLPLRLRRRRWPGWPIEIVISDEATLRSAAALAQPPQTERMPNLYVEAFRPDADELPVPLSHRPAPLDLESEAIAAIAGRALSLPADWPATVTLLRQPDGRIVVDAVRCHLPVDATTDEYRAWALAQVRQVNAAVGA